MISSIRKRFLFFALMALSSVSLPAFAAKVENDELSPPVTLAEIQSLESVGFEGEDSPKGLPFDIRYEAMKEAALSLGARAALSWRTFFIRRELDGRSVYLDKVFDFRNLLIPAPSGLLIEPPVISESVNALIIDGSGQEAAVADRVYNINVNAKIVSAARTWRNYLERDWGEVEMPPDILLPKTDEERENWIKWIRQGWDKGLVQADEIFQDDLNQLTADYQGMVRYRMLLAQDMISPPYALQVDRGVTGGGREMRVGDRAVQITGTPELRAESEVWKPASR